MKSFFDQSKQDLLKWVDRPARAARVFQAVYQERVTRFDEIATIPEASRKILADSFISIFPRLRSALIRKTERGAILSGLAMARPSSRF